MAKLGIGSQSNDGKYSSIQKGVEAAKIHKEAVVLIYKSIILFF